jgi:hypothetical protein
MIIRALIVIAAVFAALPGCAAESGWQNLVTNRVTIRYANVDRAYAEAISKIVETALAGYDTVYGLQMPERIQVRVSLDPKQRLRLWTDGDAAIFLELSSARQLAPPAQSGVFNVYGFCHELGHIALYRHMPSLMGLPDGVAEGWADYFGSMICGYVWGKLGENAWPEPHDYYKYGGPGRFEKRMQNPQAAHADPSDQAAYVLYQIDKRYGRRALGTALNAALATKPRGSDLVSLFRAELIKVTGDEKAGDLFPTAILESRATFQGGAPDLESLGSFKGEQLKADETGLLLYYDDGTMESKRSIGGGGHIIQFRAPDGTWKLDAVWLFGSRYGLPEPPQEAFSIFVCDAAMNVIAEIPKPYLLFERGPEKWVLMPFAPVAVPNGFHICLSFNPTQTKGIYVATDEGTPAGHSRVGLPYSRIGQPIAECDWMIRAHVVSEDKVDLEAVAAEWGRKLAAP